jgi:hypothetical protein
MRLLSPDFLSTWGLKWPVPLPRPDPCGKERIEEMRREKSEQVEGLRRKGVR